MKVIIFKVYFILVSILFVSFTPQSVTENYSLTINVKDLRTSEGVVQFALYNQKGSIPDEKFKKYYKISIAEIKNKQASITFNDLPEGTYAVSILHDENKDGKIDKGFILPTEGVGFSNYNNFGLSNRPNFTKASFTLKENISIAIKIIYK